jgi:hypothetical protein
VNLDENSFHFEEEMDLLDLSLLPEDRAELVRSEPHHPFAALNLERIGLGCMPQLLVWYPNTVVNLLANISCS